MNNIKLDITKAACFLEAGAVKAFEPKVKAAQEALENGIHAVGEVAVPAVEIKERGVRRNAHHIHESRPPQPQDRIVPAPLHVPRSPLPVPRFRRKS